MGSVIPGGGRRAGPGDPGLGGHPLLLSSD